MKKSRMISWLTDVFYVRPIVIVACLIVFADFIYVNYMFQYPTLNDRNGQKASIQGKIREKTYDEDGTVKSITIGQTMCYVNKLVDRDKIRIGDYVNLHGELYEFEPPMNVGEADLKKYYASKHVYFYCYADSVKIISHGKSAREWFLNARGKLSQKIMSTIRFEGGTVNTLLLGDKTYLPKERKDLYQRAGVAHFLVISGLHISAVGSFIYSMVKRTGVKRPAACMSSLLFLILYGILVGFSVSVIRAVIMFSVRLCADIFGEAYDMMNALAFAAIFTVIVNPLCLFDSAFVYSYVTVFTISLYLTYIQVVPFRRKGLLRFLRESLRIPFVLLLFVMPVTLRLSYEYSLFSVIINAVLAPMAAPILLLGFLCLFFSVFGWIGAANFFDFLLHAVLTILDKLCLAAAHLPAFTLMRRPTALEIVLYYFFLGLYFLYLRKDGSTFAKIFLIINMLYFLGNSAFYSPSVSMLYVGQGECVVIKTGANTAVISDCGSTSEKEIAHYLVVPFLKASGVKRIQTVFVSHSDSDHSGAVGELITEAENAGIRIDSITFPSIPSGKEEFKDIMVEAKKHAVGLYSIKAGATVKYGAFSFKCLSPSKDNLFYDSNADSLVLLSKTGPFDILFTGDITKDTEELLIPKLKRNDIEVLKVAHHGSKTATSEPFLKYIRPQVAIASAGINNVYHHPSEETVILFRKKKIPFFVTKECGEIDIFYNPFSSKKVYVRTISK